MIKSKLKIFRIVLFITMIMSLVCFALSCAQLKGTFSVEFGENVVFEYMTDAEIPAGEVRDDDGALIKNRAEYTFVSPSEKVYKGIYICVYI